jgi:glycosyltransferase involved in cell wall biosynthesis
MPLRLLVINNILTPYNLSFFAAVSAKPDVVTRTVLLASNDSNRMWRVDESDLTFDYRVLPSLHSYVCRVELPIYLHWGLWSDMRRFRPDVIAICGYHYFAALEVLAFALRHDVPTVLWSGSHLLSGFIKRRWADAYKRWVIGRFDAYLTYGTASREQLIHHGAPADRIVVGCNSVDVHWFKAQADALRAAAPSTSSTRLLYVGRLVAIKNVSALISAVGHLQRQGVPVSLGIVGDGPARASLEAQILSEGVRDVAFLGFLTGAALAQAYVGADALILPSTNEPWGLVVNEAAACGIPSVVSTFCGAAQDLIEEEVTGLTFDPTVAGALEQALGRIVADPAGRRRMGDAAQRFILTRDQAYSAARLVEAARLALARPRRRAPSGANDA